MESTKRRPKSKIQKAILKRLIDADMTMADVAEFYGHTAGNASVHLMRENEDYFFEAIAARKSGKPQAIAS